VERREIRNSSWDGLQITSSPRDENAIEHHSNSDRSLPVLRITAKWAGDIRFGSG
jgi:hypothetical protein